MRSTYPVQHATNILSTCRQHSQFTHAHGIVGTCDQHSQPTCNQHTQYMSTTLSAFVSPLPFELHAAWRLCGNMPTIVLMTCRARWERNVERTLRTLLTTTWYAAQTRFIWNFLRPLLEDPLRLESVLVARRSLLSTRLWNEFQTFIKSLLEYINIHT